MTGLDLFVLGAVFELLAFGFLLVVAFFVAIRKSKNVCFFRHVQTTVFQVVSLFAGKPDRREEKPGEWNAFVLTGCFAGKAEIREEKFDEIATGSRNKKATNLTPLPSYRLPGPI